MSTENPPIESSDQNHPEFWENRVLETLLVELLTDSPPPPLGDASRTAEPEKPIVKKGWKPDTESGSKSSRRKGLLMRVSWAILSVAGAYIGVSLLVPTPEPLSNLSLGSKRVAITRGVGLLRDRSHEEILHPGDRDHWLAEEGSVIINMREAPLGVQVEGLALFDISPNAEVRIGQVERARGRGWSGVSFLSLEVLRGTLLVRTSLPRGRIGGEIHLIDPTIPIAPPGAIEFEVVDEAVRETRELCRTASIQEIAEKRLLIIRLVNSRVPNDPLLWGGIERICMELFDNQGLLSEQDRGQFAALVLILIDLGLAPESIAIERFVPMLKGYRK